MSTRARRGLIIIAILLSPFVVGLLLTYQVIRVPFASDMSSNPAFDYQEGPRRLPAAGAVPLQGEAILGEEFPSNPVPADENSLQRGKILFSIHCALCHGEQGRGDGPLGVYFARIPADLSSPATAEEFDGSVYLAILQGYGQMPSLAENLSVGERWDVINYVRTLADAAASK